jgi:splicing factor 3B subunit 1
MLTALRPDIDNKDDVIRNKVARAFAVVAGALGVPQMLPFLKAVCKSKKSWEARHTGCKVIQQIAVLFGCGVLPFLEGFVEILDPLLADENSRVKSLACLAISELAAASAPFGIESFDRILERLWNGLNSSHSRLLASFLQAVGSLIPLMSEEFASSYITYVMNVVLREFRSPDEEMKRILLKVVKQCLDNKMIKPVFVLEKLVPEFWDSFWLRKFCVDRIASQQLSETTLSLARKVGSMQVLPKLITLLKEDHEPLRRTAADTLVRILQTCGVAEIEPAFDEKIIDAMMFAFHQQMTEDNNFMLEKFAQTVTALGLRSKPHLPGIITNVFVRIKTKSPKIRQQAADLITHLASILGLCDEERLLVTISQMLYENLGEEFPEVLGSIIGAIKAVLMTIGPERIHPGIQDLLPSLTPILQNRHEKVQEQLVDLIGKIADKAADHVNPKEWIRICFDLLDLLKADRKTIRRATVNTFGYIAKAIGPQDVILTLINNLKVQERQMRICTTVAIAIVAEACGPFTVIPALMNEYRVPSNNIQNGVLKSFSFMFEYIGEMAKDYVYAVTPMLDDALLDRDLVHRQTASTILRHMALGVVGFGCEDVLIHLFNSVIANLFETSPHVINAVTEAFEALRIAVGPGHMLLYVLQGLFHPAKRVREMYWRLYNFLYIGAQDALVPFFPKLETSSGEIFNRIPETTLYNI